jgi:hypothetical protein
MKRMDKDRSRQTEEMVEGVKAGGEWARRNVELCEF